MLISIVREVLAKVPRTLQLSTTITAPSIAFGTGGGWNTDGNIVYYHMVLFVTYIHKNDHTKT